MTALMSLVSMGLLVKVVSNTEETKQELREATGWIQKLEEEVKQIREVQLIQTRQKLTLTPRERECLAKNVFLEAGVEDYVGKLAVAQATLNRVNHPTRWSSDICKVVYQKAQFSWTLDKKKRTQKPAGKLFAKSLEAVRDFENGIRIKELSSATFYHTDYIKKPKWVDDSKKVAVIGRHIFYNDDKKI